MKIEMGIGWVPSDNPGHIRSANPGEYAAEIERLQMALAEVSDETLSADERRGIIARALRWPLDQTPRQSKDADMALYYPELDARMEKDIIERLNDCLDVDFCLRNSFVAQLMQDAKDEIETLRQLVRTLCTRS